MKNKLTINDLAVGNLKQHKKQYTVMIIGIILAMVFSSSVIFMISTMYNSIVEIRNERYGKQSVILVYTTGDEVNKAKESKVLGKSGFAHLIGSLKSADENYYEEIKIGWLDDTASELANQTLIDGRMPTGENEIAIEKMSLAKLGISAKVGDEITINLYPQNGKDILEKCRPVTYKLVGILKNKAVYINENEAFEGEYVPSAFVCKNTDVDIGGKESLTCYARYYDNRENAENKRNLAGFLESLGYTEQQAYDKFNSYNLRGASVSDSADSVTGNFRFVIIIVFVLMVASCLVIINSFNSNLNERKKQIGMFRAIGATKKQIRRIFSREAFLICIITTPVSCFISAAVVKTIVHFMGDAFVFKMSAWVVVLAVAFCVLSVMVSASIPLFSASRITPIQSIRNIENTRTLNKKKIKSKKNFDVPSLLANRSLTFGKGKQIAVSVILIVAIVGSGFALSFYTFEKRNIRTIDSDYNLSIYTPGQRGYVNYTNRNVGFTEHDRRFIEENEYIGDSSGKKIGVVNLLIPTDTSEYRMFLSGNYNSDSLKVLDKTNYREHLFSKRKDSYDFIKVQELLKVNDFMSTELISHDADYLKSLEKNVYDGKINIEKINSGEEIILYAPKKVGMTQYFDKQGRLRYGGYPINDDVEKENCFFKAESDFRAGEEIEIAVLTGYAPTGKESFDNDETIIPNDVKVRKKKVKIGAVISSYDGDSISTQSAVITSSSFMNTLIPNLKYNELDFKLNVPCTDEVEKSVMENMNYICSDIKDSNIHSNYGYAQEVNEELNIFLVAALSVVILLFVISLSIVNNTLTSHIKNSKAKIGTLRAVGADEKAIVKSYIYQLLSMLMWGSGLGLIAFLASYYISYGMHLLSDKQIGFETDWLMICNPTAAIIFIILAFVICSLNLWFKIRKEMKNSIVENIREL